jgi:ubiquinone/menaquinone biosynthesis C-methylase UbiE
MTVGPNGLPRAAVPAAFDQAADAYDWLVGANPGYHRHLRKSVQRMCIPGDGRGLRLLDAGCGTGASTAALLAAAPAADIVAVDASAGMLQQAAAKRWPTSVRFVHAPIEELATAGVEGPFDGILAAYLLRNLDDPVAQLARFRALLRPGAILALHEYSVRDSPMAVAVWNTVCPGIVLPLAWWHTRDVTLYRHLWRSVNDFDGAGELRNKLVSAGFDDVRSQTMAGWQRNIVHTFLAVAPQ